jgi:hypothetical protein
MEAEAPPPADLLAELREQRGRILVLLQHDTAESEAMAAFDEAPAVALNEHADWYRPQGLAGPDRLTAGPLQSYAAHRQASQN